MTPDPRFSRRRFVDGCAGSGAEVVLGAGTSVLRSTEALAVKRAPVVVRQLWGGPNYSDDGSNLLVDTITTWGEAEDVETEAVMINEKVSAAVEPGSWPTPATSTTGSGRQRGLVRVGGRSGRPGRARRRAGRRTVRLQVDDWDGRKETGPARDCPLSAG